MSIHPRLPVWGSRSIRPKGVRNVATGTAYASSITRTPGGAISSLAYPNGRTLAQTFTLRGEPLTIHDGPVWLSYTPTPAGDIGVVVDQSEDPAGCVRSVSRSLSYDFQDRLGWWNDTVGTGAGVCSAETLGSQAAGFTYVAGTDQIASQRAPDVNGKAVYAFGYDYAGSISAIGQYDAAGSSITQAVCLRHDALNRLLLVGTTSTAPTPGGTACVTDAEVSAALGRFKYDSRNRRVARQVGGQWTYVVSDRGGNPLSEIALTNGTWTKVRDYVWLGGRLLAQVEYAGQSTYSYYGHLDHLGAPRALTNASGQVVWATFQRPYAELGEKTVADPLSGQTVVTNLRLPGQYDERLLAGLGIQGPYYNWNRWYVPAMGRYLELDPIALRGSFNAANRPDWFNYANGNPISFVDFDGRFAPSPPPVLPPWVIPLIPWILPNWPGTTGGDPCENSREGCVPQPPDCSPKKKMPGCACKCFGRGWGPAPLPRQKDAFSCESECNSQYWQDHPGNVTSECK